MGRQGQLGPVTVSSMVLNPLWGRQIVVSTTVVSEVWGKLNDYIYEM